MNCASCGSPNREGRRFCGRCGASLVNACPDCGAPNDTDESFCGQCGTRLREAAVADPAARAAPVASEDSNSPRTAERRHVTVLFADLVGFTTFSDQRDAEDVRES